MSDHLDSSLRYYKGGFSRKRGRQPPPLTESDLGTYDSRCKAALVAAFAFPEAALAESVRSRPRRF
jgi:hypothetical protein